MHPAASVILLTTLIGAGQGLTLVLFALDLGVQLGTLDPVKPLAVTGCAIAVLLLVAGLGASFFHLGHPERAWRAAAKWRTSWLSREVIVLPALIASVAMYGVAHRLDWGAAPWVGALSAVLCIALFICTGMIYACLKFLQEWHTPLTVVNFTLLGTTSGALGAAALAAFLAPHVAPVIGLAALLLLVAGAISSRAQATRNRRLRARSSLQTAIGVKHPQIRQLAQGFSAGSFNTREFFHGQPKPIVARVRRTALVFGFVLPTLIALVALNAQAGILWSLAFAVQMLGMGCERWTFFAEARHPQNLYYQRAA